MTANGFDEVAWNLRTSAERAERGARILHVAIVFWVVGKPDIIQFGIWEVRSNRSVLCVNYEGKWIRRVRGLDESWRNGGHDLGSLGRQIERWLVTMCQTPFILCRDLMNIYGKLGLVPKYDLVLGSCDTPELRRKSLAPKNIPQRISSLFHWTESTPTGHASNSRPRLQPDGSQH